jgi:hypothetical protein
LKERKIFLLFKERNHTLLLLKPLERVPREKGRIKRCCLNKRSFSLQVSLGLSRLWHLRTGRERTSRLNSGEGLLARGKVLQSFLWWSWSYTSWLTTTWFACKLRWNRTFLNLISPVYKYKAFFICQFDFFSNFLVWYVFWAFGEWAPALPFSWWVLVNTHTSQSRWGSIVKTRCGKEWARLGGLKHHWSYFWLLSRGFYKVLSNAVSQYRGGRQWGKAWTLYGDCWWSPL